tara:strand:+ start:146 stop:1090 length:945 start_codon:yes stop_codon:yes gene_type:complete
MDNKLFITIVIPLFNEEESLNQLYNEIVDNLKKYKNWEIIFVDDGSDDNSKNIIENIIKNNNKVKLLCFYKNYGKADALSEGFKQAQGNIVITMDADLQDDPSEIHRLINKINEGWDLVSGWKKNRNDPKSKTVPSKFFNFITRFITGLKIHDFNCGLKAYRNNVVKSIDIYGGLHRYIPVIAYQKGFKVTEIEVNHRARKFGNSKYGGYRYFHGFFDLFTVLFTSKYFNRPLHFFGFIGILLLILGIIINIYLTIGWFNGIWIGNRPIFFLGILLLIVGIQFFSIGLLGELLIKTSGSNEKKIQSIISSSQDK